MQKYVRKFDEAEISFRRAIELKPGLAEAHGNLGIALHQQRRLDEAEACYREAIAIKPDYAEAHNDLGRNLENWVDWMRRKQAVGKRSH